MPSSVRVGVSLQAWILSLGATAMLADCGRTQPYGPSGAPVTDAGCVATTCTARGATCGTAPDGCGGIISCGACAAGEVCGGAGANRCGASPCAAQTCASQGADCALVSDG